MHVSELWIYPIKSCRGVRVDALDLGDRGPRGDRRWMLVDENGTFISQRTTPRLALVDIRIADDDIVASAPGMTPLTIKPPAHETSEVCQIFDDSVSLRNADANVSAWFAEFLQTNCRLMYMPDASERVVDERYSPERRLVSLADGYPLLLIGQGSLDLLNGKLAAPVPMQRFRPNIVVAESAPHAEDDWRSIRIGDIACSVVKPCARCTIPTVDIATGRMSKEPLRTLSTYRKKGSNVFFGQNVIHETRGRISAGDLVHVVE